MKEFKDEYKDSKIFLIGNKLDLEESRVITREEAIKFQKDNNIDYFFETSAKDGINAQEVFVQAAKVLYQDYLINKNVSKKKDTINENKKTFDSPVQKSKDDVLNKSSLIQKNPYDIILSFKSFNSLKEGWDIKFSEQGIKYFDKLIKCQKVGILGNKSVGKSFILSKLFGLSKNEYPFYSDDKISIKLKERKNKINYMIFDSQGLDYPILKEKVSSEYGGDDKEDIIDNLNIDNINNNLVIMKSEEDIEKELENNQRLTEEFISQFIIDYSDMLICVVGIMKYSEQVMIKHIMEQCIKYQKDNLYIIHNIPLAKDKMEIEYYFKNIIMKYGIFDLEEQNEININDDSNSEGENEISNDDDDEKSNTGLYYFSKYKSKLNVYHLIFINDNCEEKSYNDFAKKKIEQFLNISKRTKFNISENIKKKIYDLVEEYSNNKEKIKLEITEPKDNEAKITIKGVDNLDINYVPKKMKNDIKFEYNYYISKEDEKEKLVILIERPGNIIDIEIIPKKNNKMYIIQYKGKKVMTEEELKYKENMKNVGRKFDEFNLDIPISLKGYEISNLEKPNHYDKNGIGYIEYNLSKL